MSFMSTDKCEEYFNEILQVLVEPGKESTQHDRQRVMFLIMHMRPKDVSLNRYLMLTMTDEDKEAVLKLAEDVLK